MNSHDNCPTCGATLGPLHADALRHCDACERPNPQGFRYCGFCATPMGSDVERAEVADVAAPPGGWPSLSRELVELRFYMERGELDEAFELLTILRARHPGHPALAEFSRTPDSQRPRPDTQVNRVVDSVLAGSQSLNSAMPRRSVPQWKAEGPTEADPRPKTSTRAHATVPLGSPKDAPLLRKRIVRADSTPRSFPAVGAAPGVPIKTPRAATTKHVGAIPPTSPKKTPATKPGTASRGPDAITKPEPIAPPTDAEASEWLLAGESRSGMTVAVPTLQTPSPYQDDGSRPNKAVQSVVRKRALKSRKRTGKEVLVESRKEEENPRRRLRGDSFGQHVLGRMGRRKPGSKS